MWLRTGKSLSDKPKLGLAKGQKPSRVALTAHQQLKPEVPDGLPKKKKKICK